MTVKYGNQRTVKLLGIRIKNEFKVEESINSVFTKAPRKPSVLMKLSKYQYFKKLTILFKTYFQF